MFKVGKRDGKCKPDLHLQCAIAVGSLGPGEMELAVGSLFLFAVLGVIAASGSCAWFSLGVVCELLLLLLRSALLIVVSGKGSS